MKKYVYVIDTDQYAGNFEREMCAYITGITGDCEVGSEFAELYTKDTGEEESKFLDYIEMRSDNGCNRPCEIWRKDSKQYNAVAIFFQKLPPNDMLQTIQSRASTFAEAKRTIGGEWYRKFKLKIKSFSIVEEKTVSKKRKL
jgi:hypothetical protein